MEFEIPPGGAVVVALGSKSKAKEEEKLRQSTVLAAFDIQMKGQETIYEADQSFEERKEPKEIPLEDVRIRR